MSGFEVHMKYPKIQQQNVKKKIHDKHTVLIGRNKMLMDTH